MSNKYQCVFCGGAKGAPSKMACNPCWAGMTLQEKREWYLMVERRYPASGIRGERP